jgi:hypothetical protein
MPASIIAAEIAPDINPKVSTVFFIKARSPFSETDFASQNVAAIRANVAKAALSVVTLSDDLS